MPALVFESLRSQADVLAQLGAIDYTVAPVTAVTADFVTLTYSNGVAARVGYERDGTGFVLGDVELFDASDTALFRIPNFDFAYFPDMPGLQPSVSAYYGQFNAIQYIYSAADDVIAADLFFSGDAGAILPGLTSGLTGTALEDNRTELDRLADQRLSVDFGAGADTLVLGAARNAASVRTTPSNDPIVTDSRGELRATGLEKLAFTDGALIFDESGAYADYTYALYAAALTRTPDEAGFRFWNGVMNSGDFDGPTREDTELRLAEAFVTAPEFTGRFDVSTDESYIDALYTNVLGRTADQAGKDFWLDVFASPDQGREDLLRFFAVSDENQTRIEPDIEDGFWVL